MAGVLGIGRATHLQHQNRAGYREYSRTKTMLVQRRHGHSYCLPQYYHSQWVYNAESDQPRETEIDRKASYRRERPTTMNPANSRTAQYRSRNRFSHRSPCRRRVRRVGNSAIVPMIDTAQTTMTTKATITQPTHPDPGANGLSLSVTATSFPLCSRCGMQAAQSVCSVKICSRRAAGGAEAPPSSARGGGNMNREAEPVPVVGRASGVEDEEEEVFNASVVPQ
jgi:hypothetical protein